MARRWEKGGDAVKGLILAFALLLGGCASSEKYVKVSEESLPKTVSIQVTAIVQQVMVDWGPDGITITESTATVKFLGAGVFISDNGHVLTVEHLFDAGQILGITVCQYDGTCQGAEILSIDVKKDLALIRVEGPTPNYARVADPRKLRVGQEVLAIGSPLGLDFSVSHGIISALNRDFAFRYDATQSDTPINPGNSGGPLFNLAGELVGINSFMIPPVNAPVFTGLGFSTSGSEIVKFLTDVRAKYESLPKLTTSYWGS
jgi:serine protease Do